MVKKSEIKFPMISVVMATFNREAYVSDSIESILKQTYSDFEFIIIDDCSSDNTYHIVKKYASKDQRIVLLKNESNKGLIYSLNKGLQKAKGKYIARMDDDDISMPQRLAKQINFLETNKEITVVGSYLKSFGEDGIEYKTWVDVDKHYLVEIMLQFKCPISHPNVMIRKSFLNKYNLQYDEKYKHAEDYGLWLDIIKHGGKIENIPEVLLIHRATKNSISRSQNTSKIQIQSAEYIKKQFLPSFLSNAEKNEIINSLKIHPFDCNKKKDILNALEKIKYKAYPSAKEYYDEFINIFCGVKSDIHIFFINEEENMEQLCVTMASILYNATNLDQIYFHCFGNYNKDSIDNILTLRAIKDFEIEFIKVSCATDDNYYTKEIKSLVFALDLLATKLNKCLFLKAGLIVEDSLNLLWNEYFEGCDIAAVESFKYVDYINLERFEIEVILFNLKNWNLKIKEDLIFKSEIAKLIPGKTVYHVLNQVFKNKVKYISHRYATKVLQVYNQEYVSTFKDDFLVSQWFPMIICYGYRKPWIHGKFHALANRYFDYLRLTPYITSNTPSDNISSSKPFGAVDLVKNHLSYKIGTEVLTSKNIFRIFSLPFRIYKTKKQHAFDQKIYLSMIKINPSLKKLSLESYEDYQEALKVKNYLSYKIGELLVKHPFLFMFKITRVYKEWKNK
ncbi:TPA: glycosyltransferase family 2 protein [Campylobacter coli]|nr:glycosyltransferase family 2 protein [Campylobacter coli]